ncbi:hypothetical protein BX616_003167 [Lobosporangium transversale]|uniref:F-box domain-containing protein n=1 Tax=Lobosporangium transversale TaxID=64571 RepID=A0A1Y2GMX0_9FUNG|nr:hypothetical protein BCR41DRAFT_353453 [Lobosporangium transversale]KAF9916670.1 hypothetical protein BX616_003167 [Lobosporangium transversale]ORZ16057.1 hypothetical protein BCR41DRAFT_353453 [Lobosporangium transversale]|eukprot:XP_021881404.1 hypothetical protein BCR41DRAFT_353453 [Lobosporangium transversale]
MSGKDSPASVDASVGVPQPSFNPLFTSSCSSFELVYDNDPADSVPSREDLIIYNKCVYDSNNSDYYTGYSDDYEDKDDEDDENSEVEDDEIEVRFNTSDSDNFVYSPITGFEQVTLSVYDDDSGDDVLSLDGSEDAAPSTPTLEPILSNATKHRRARDTKALDKPDSSFLFKLPSPLVHTIFSYLDISTIHSSLVVSKSWFQFAASHLYRDPFRSLERSAGIYAEFQGESNNVINNSLVAPQLRSEHERLLVRLLLRSICCPSEPGEEVVIAAEEADDVLGLCRLIDSKGVEIRTTVNYMRFLEVFDWAPWQRYLDYWFELRTSFEAFKQTIHQDNRDSADVEASGVPPIRRTSDPHVSPALLQPFRFSYHTIFDWFAENPNPRAIVFHEVLDLPPQVIAQLSRWTTLRFNHTTKSYSVDQPLISQLSFNHLNLIQALVEHENAGDTAVMDGNGIERENSHQLDSSRRGIRHLQLPPLRYIQGEQAERTGDQILMLLTTRHLVSLDTSELPEWQSHSTSIPSEYLQHLVRYTDLRRTCGGYSPQLFLRRCPKLAEIEMVVNSMHEVDFITPRPVIRLYTGDVKQEDGSKGEETSIYREMDQMRISTLTLTASSSSSSSPSSQPATPPTQQAIRVARLYVRNSLEIPHVLRQMVQGFSHTLRRLIVVHAPVNFRLYFSHSAIKANFVIHPSSFAMPHLEELQLFLTRRMRLQGRDPFGACPRLQRLSLFGEGLTIADYGWRVPETIRELVIDGYSIRASFDFKCLSTTQLSSLSLLHGNLSWTEPHSWANFWTNPTESCVFKNLRTLILEKSSAMSFQFEWLAHFSGLETLKIFGLNYSHISQLCYPLDSEDSALPNRGQLLLRLITQMAQPHTSYDQVACKSLKDFGFTLVDRSKNHFGSDNPSALDTSAKQPQDKAIQRNTAELRDQLGLMPLITPDDDSNKNDDGDQSRKHINDGDKEPDIFAKITGDLDCALLVLLHRYCPNVERLSFNTLDPNTRLQMETVIALKTLFPRLTRFRDESFKLNHAGERALARFDFHRRFYAYLPNRKWEDCVYQFDQVDFLRLLSV